MRLIHVGRDSRDVRVETMGRGDGHALKYGRCLGRCDGA
jgi:hypothetical protein